MNTTQKKIHYYVGILLGFITKVKVRVTTPKHIKSILETAPTDMERITETLSANPLFQVQECGGTFQSNIRISIGS